MSNDISFVVKVQDSFSKNTARFGGQIDQITAKVLRLDEQLKKVQGNLNINVRGSSIDANAIIRPLTEIQNKLREFSYGSFSTLGKVQRANEHIIRSNRDLSRSFNEVKDSVSTKTSAPTGGAMAAGNKVNFGNVARAFGYYKAIDVASNMPANLLQTRRELDSLNATLEAVLPQYDKTKSASQLAAEEFDYLTRTTYRLGVSFEAAKEEYVKFLAASAGKKDSLKDVRRQFEAFASLSRVYGIAPYRFGLIMNALTQMKSKGIITLEELQRQLGDSLPGAMKIFADALGMSEAQFRKLISTVGVSSNVINKVGDFILTDGAKMRGLEKASGGLDAQINRLNNSWYQLKKTITDGDTAELARDIIGGIDLALQGLTFSVKGLGMAWHDLKTAFKDNIMDKVNRKFHPEIERENNLSSIGSFNDYISSKTQGAMNMSSIPAPQFSAAPQDVNVKLTFENAPPGLKTDVSYPKESGSLGITTEGY